MLSHSSEYVRAIAIDTKVSYSTFCRIIKLLDERDIFKGHVYSYMSNNNMSKLVQKIYKNHYYKDAFHYILTVSI